MDISFCISWYNSLFRLSFCNSIALFLSSFFMYGKTCVLYQYLVQVPIFVSYYQLCKTAKKFLMKQTLIPNRLGKPSANRWSGSFSPYLPGWVCRRQWHMTAQAACELLMGCPALEPLELEHGLTSLEFCSRL